MANEKWKMRNGKSRLVSPVAQARIALPQRPQNFVPPE
jgi:hypothetical protein